MGTPTVLADLFDAGELAHCLAERLVVARRHPHRDLTILNYTERCQYERGLWNPVTLQCRGLIHDSLGVIHARPFRKFFNHGQSEAGALDLAARCAVTDKLDGSLGILYGHPGEYAMATRGAFESQQAHHATALLRRCYPEYIAPNGYTVLFEIVYPENRIVLDYGQRDDLILLGAVNIATGRSIGPHDRLLVDWPGPRAELFEYATVADALAASPRPNAEGLVIHLLDSDERVKVKQEDYVALHRIVTGLNERTIHEHLAAGKPLADMLGVVPDEFHGWVSEVAARLVATVDHHAAEIETAYSTILGTLPPDFTRKDFALAAKQTPHMTFLFARHDGKDFRAKLWDDHRPAPFLGPRGLVPTEETA